MYQRLIARHLQQALLDTPAVLLVGPRRAGKTTLARLADSLNRDYRTLDDPTTLAAARSDPMSFIRGMGRVVIDEVQRAPELLLPIKSSIDNDSRPGRFLLTGSANVMSLPRVADSLAGRIETVRLLPLSQCEIAGREPAFLEQIFAASIAPVHSAVIGDDLIRLVLAGGFPEVLVRDTERRRFDWCAAYVESILARDLREIAEIEKVAELPRFTRLLAQHAGQLVNFSRLGSEIGVSYKTSQRYLALLAQVFMISVLPPWYTNAIKRITKTPKLYFIDSAVLAATRGLGFDKLKQNRTPFGAMLENFVYTELLKLAGAAEEHLDIYHFRDQQGHEVDFVLERADGGIVGIEVKASATLTNADFAGLRLLATACGERFVYGVVLFDGHSVTHFGERLAAVPLSCLWN